MSRPPLLRRLPRARLCLAVAVAVVAGAGLTATADAATSALPYQDPSAPVATRVADLLGRMTLDDKIGQMTQAERAVAGPGDVTTYRLGSVLSGGGSAPSPNTPTGWADMFDGLQRGALATPLGIPILYGVDAVHGNNNVSGSTIFPHNIGLGATRDPALAQQVGRAVAEEVTGAGLNWTFAPCLCVARDDRWGRTYESFGETPDLVSSMTPIVTGFQGQTLGGAPASVLATAKHYLGDGGTTGGKDQGNTQLTEAELRAVHLPPFKAAIDRGVGSIMVTYNSWNGAKASGSKFLLTDLLKGELGFTGFLVSDWAAIDQLDGATGFTQNEVVTSINAGLDMIMVPNDYKTFLTYLRNAVNAGQIPMTRIDDAVRRILTKKFELGLFEHPLADRSFTASVGGQAHRDLARQAVRESQVLLRNTGVLPLARNAKVFVAGKNADDLGNQAGGWTMSWQGGSGATIPGTTILAGIRNTVGSTGSVTYSKDGSGINSSYTAAVAVVGETPYAEGRGDRTSLALDSTDLSTLSRLQASGVPVVVVLVSGRPMELPSDASRWAGLIASWLPGSEGQGVADVLFGAYNPTGKLPMTWPQTTGQEPINDGDGKTAAYPFGFGLSYSTTTPSPTPTTPSPTPTTPSPTPTTPSPTPTTPSPTPTTPSPTPTTPSPTPTTPSPTVGTATCRVSYRTDDWGSGFTATVGITNTGPSAISGWTLRWTFAGNQKITNSWNGVVTQTGTQVAAANPAWAQTLAAGAATSVGFQATYSGSNPAPTQFTLNGSPCTTS